MRIRVTGRVQGVGFRAACEAEARALGLVGWVKNLPDGSVEVVAEGPEEALAALADWCRRGPRGARVLGVELDREIRPPAGTRGFTVAR